MPKEKVKIVAAHDNDTFTIIRADGTERPLRLTGSNGTMYDAYETKQQGFKLDDAVTSLIGKEVTVNFQDLDEKGKKKNSGRDLGSISAPGIPDLGEHLYNKSALLKRGTGDADYHLNIKEVSTDSLHTPLQYKAVQSLLVRKEAHKNDPKQNESYRRNIQTLKEKYGFKTNEELVAFVERRSKVPYNQLKTFQTQPQVTQTTPTVTQPTMATPTANPAKPLARPTVQRLSTEQGIQALSGELIDNYEEIRAGLGDRMQDVRGWELHTKGDTKYLYPLLKGATLNEWKNTLAEGTKAGQAETSFAGNSYATGKQAVENWKRTYSENKGTTSATGVASGIKGKGVEGIENTGNPMMDYTKPVTQGTYTGVEKDTSFLTKNLIPPKEGDPEFKIEDEGGKSIDGFKLASSLFLNLGAAFNPEPFTSGAMNTVGNKLYRDATNTKFSDAPVLNTLDELLGYSGAIGYLGATAPVGAVLEGGSTAMSTAKIAKITAKMTSLMKSAKNSKALTGSLTAAALSLGGKEAYNAVVSAGEKYGVNTPEFWKEVGVSAVPLIVGGFAMKKNFRNGKAAGLKTTRSLRTDFPKVTPVTPSKRYVNGVLKTPTILQSKLPFTRQLPNSSGTVFNKTFYDKAIKTNAGGFKNVKPKPATNWTTASGMKFKQGGTLKFQRGGGIPKFQTSGIAPYNYQSVPFTNPTTGVNSYMKRSQPWGNGLFENKNSQGNYNVYLQNQKKQQSLVDAGYDLGASGVDGYWGNKSQAAQDASDKASINPHKFGSVNTLTPHIAGGTSFSPNKVIYGTRQAVAYDIKPSKDSYSAETFDNRSSDARWDSDKGYKQRPQFGYQEANLALSILPSLLNTKVKADRLSYRPYNPEIRGIQGDPLLQQRLTSVAQNKYLQNKATSSDPTQELVRRLVVNKQAMQGNQEAYNVDTQARISDTQRYYGERNAANQFNYTNKQNTDNQNIQMNNAAMMQNAAQKNQAIGQTLQNTMGYMSNKANDRNLLNQNYLAHKNIERQGLLDNITNQYAAMYNAAQEADRPRIQMEWNAAISEARNKYGVDNIYRNAQGYVPYQGRMNKEGGKLMYKKGGSISDTTRLEGIAAKKSTDTDKLFIQTAYKYNELSSKVSSEALNRGAKLVVATLNNLPKSTLKSLPFKKLF